MKKSHAGWPVFRCGKPADPADRKVLLVSRILTLLAALAGFGLQAQTPSLPDLQISNFSVYSTLLQPDGSRLVVAGFRILNAGTAPAAASFTLVKMGTGTAAFSIPALPPGQAAFLSQAITSNLSQVSIEITADAGQTVTESDETNNKLQYVAHLDKAETDRWQSVGPSRIAFPDNNSIGVGRVTTIALDPRSTDRLFVGARGSGLWMTFDAGQHWTPVTDSLPTTQIDAVTIDPANRDRVLIATPAGVFQSTDGGSVWIQLTSQDLKGQGSDGGAFLVGPGNPAPLYLSSANGLEVSTDGGHTWNLVIIGGPVVSLQFNSTDHSRLFAALSSPASPPPGFSAGVFAATGGGLTPASWRKLKGCPDAPLPTFPAKAQVWIAEAQGPMWMSFKSTTNSQLFRSMNTPCQTTTGIEDAWQPIPVSGACLDITNQWSLLYAPLGDPGVLFKAGVDLCRSGSQGKSLVPVGPVHSDQHALVATTANPAIMYLGNDGGIYRSDNAGASWRFIGEGLAVTELYDIDNSGVPPRVFVGASQDNQFLTWPGGTSPVWNLEDCPVVSDCGDTELVAFDRNDKSVMYEIGQSTTHLNRYKDGGSQTAIGDPNHDCIAAFETPVIVESLVSTGGTPPLAVTCGGVWAGPPWTQVLAAPSGSNFVRVKLGPGGIWLAGTDRGTVMGGSNLALLTTLFQATAAKNVSALAFAGANTFYVGMTSRIGPGETGPRIFRLDCQFATPPKCTSQEIGASLPTGEIMAIAVDPLHTDTVLVAIRGKGVFRGVFFSLVVSPGTALAAAAAPAKAPTGHAVGTVTGTGAVNGTVGGTGGTTKPVVPPGLINIFNTWHWTPYNNGLPSGVTATNILVDQAGHFLLSTFGRGAFVLFSGIEPATTGTASGFLKSFDLEHLTAGPHSPLFLTVTIDSRPGWIFTAVNPGVTATALKNAFTNHRRVILSFTIVGPQHGVLESGQ